MNDQDFINYQRGILPVAIPTAMESTGESSITSADEPPTVVGSATENGCSSSRLVPEAEVTVVIPNDDDDASNETTFVASIESTIQQSQARVQSAALDNASTTVVEDESSLFSDDIRRNSNTMIIDEHENYEERIGSIRNVSEPHEINNNVNGMYGQVEIDDDDEEEEENIFDNAQLRFALNVENFEIRNHHQPQQEQHLLLQQEQSMRTRQQQQQQQQQPERQEFGGGLAADHARNLPGHVVNGDIVVVDDDDESEEDDEERDIRDQNENQNVDVDENDDDHVNVVEQNNNDNNNNHNDNNMRFANRLLTRRMQRFAAALAARDGARTNAAAAARAAADDDVDDDDDDDAVTTTATVTTQDLENVSSYLYDMIREDRTCTSILSGWSQQPKGCQSVVEHCQQHPEEAFYISVHGRTPIQEACLRGACHHVVKALITANPLGASDLDLSGNTALHYLFIDFSLSSTRSAIVCSQDMDQVVTDLLSINPNMMASTVNVGGNTPLHMACTAPEVMVQPNSIVQLLEANPRNAARLNLKDQSPLMLHCQRRNASLQVAKLLLNAYPLALRELDNEDGWAPIHYVAANGNYELLQYLIQSYPEAASIRTSKQQTALHLLCRHLTHNMSSVSSQQQHQKQHRHITSSSALRGNGNRHSNNAHVTGGSITTGNIVAAVNLLLAADPDAVMQRDAVDSYTPLHLLCKAGGSSTSLKIIQLLLSCNPHAASVPDIEGYIPLHHACEIGCNVEIIQALLKCNPQGAQAKTRKQDTPLSLACTCNKSVDTVQALIDVYPQALTKKNDYGFAPLHCVCRAYQPRMGIVQALLEASPSCVHLKTNAGETPVHLASSNSGAFVGVLQLLITIQNDKRPASSANKGSPGSASVLAETEMIASRIDHTHRVLDSTGANNGRAISTTNKIGNTPLHDACFRGSPYEHIETLAMANPEWLSIRNNIGYTPLQILCKKGRIDERIISTFARIGGPEIFSVVDSNGNTPLHSAMREDTNVASLICLIRTLPDALYSKTVYGDSPLHLACFRRASPEIVREAAMAASNGHASPVLERNLAGQTPIGIAMEEYRATCQGRTPCCVTSVNRGNQTRAFLVLATLVKILFYGPVKYRRHDEKDLSLLRACVALHRQNIRLDPAFIRRAIRANPEEVRMLDEDGNYPLHIESSIPIEKMSLLDGRGGCCGGKCHKRMGILRLLLEMFPDATKQRNKENEFPLGLMINSGRLWSHTIAVTLQAFPPALHWYKGLDDQVLPNLLERVSKECGTDAIFSLLTSRPDLFEESNTS